MWAGCAFRSWLQWPCKQKSRKLPLQRLVLNLACMDTQRRRENQNGGSKWSSWRCISGEERVRWNCSGGVWLSDDGVERIHRVGSSSGCQLNFLQIRSSFGFRHNRKFMIVAQEVELLVYDLDHSPGLPISNLDGGTWMGWPIGLLAIGFCRRYCKGKVSLMSFIVMYATICQNMRKGNGSLVPMGFPRFDGVPLVFKLFEFPCDVMRLLSLSV